MFDFGRVVRVLGEELGEAGAEAVISACEYYLSEAQPEEFSCEEDKLLLLMLLYSFSDSFIKEEFDPLRHFVINFNFKEI